MHVDFQFVHNLDLVNQTCIVLTFVKRRQNVNKQFPSVTKTRDMRIIIGVLEGLEGDIMRGILQYHPRRM